MVLGGFLDPVERDTRNSATTEIEKVGGKDLLTVVIITIPSISLSPGLVCCGESGNDPLRELWVNDSFVYPDTRFFDQRPNHRILVRLLRFHAHHLLAIKEDKERSQGFCIPIHEVAELREDREPSVVRTKG